MKIADIVVPKKRARAARDITQLAESIKAVGLLHPITVTPERTLISGLHRLRACESLGWKSIPATTLTLDALDRELAEIDENLVRSDLTILERAEQVARRKAIYEAKFPAAPTKAGAPIGNRNAAPVKINAAPGAVLNPSRPAAPSFSAATTKATGIAARTIREDVQIATAIPRRVRDVVRASPAADDRKALVALSRVAPERQLEVARKLAAGVATSRAVRRELDFYPTPAQALSAIRLAIGHDLPGGRWLEPSAGDGSIVRAFADDDVEWDLVELNPAAREHLDPLGSLHVGDYLARAAPAKRYAVGVANPPFDQAEAFVRKLLAECNVVVALLPLAFAASVERFPLHDEHRSDLYVLADRPSFTGDGKTDMRDVAWFVWGLGSGGSWRVLAPEERP